MFQHDQGRSHIARKTTELLEEFDINFIDCTPKGADLSPIELYFGEIQRRAKDKYSKIDRKLAGSINLCVNI